MKQTIMTGFIVFVIVSLLSVVVWGSRKKQAEIASPQNEQVANNNTPINIGSESIIFFYGNTCPHCKDVEEWMRENKVEEKINIVKKEVYDNRANSLELARVANSCGLSTDSIGVPFLYTKEKQCLIGTPDITAYLAEQINKQEIPIDASESAERSRE